MRNLTFVMMLLTVLLRAGAGQPIDRAKLRQLARMPRLSLEYRFGISFSETGGFGLAEEKRDVQAKVAEARAGIHGSSADPDRWNQLGRLYDRLGDSRRAKDACTRAITLYRQGLKDHPNDGRLLAGLGSALNEMDRMAEAESVLRRGVRVAPREWRSWEALGQLDHDNAWRALFGRALPRSGFHLDFARPYDALISRLGAHRPSAELIARMEKRLAEARRCYDRAVAVAPGEPQPYESRAAFTFAEGLGRWFIGFLRGERQGNIARLFSPAIAADLWRAARLRPDDYRAQALAATIEVLTAALPHIGQSGAGDGALWSILPEESRRRVTTAADQLQKLLQGGDKRKVAGAAEALGVLQFAANDKTSALTTLRRAVEIDPQRDGAWEILMGILVETQQFGDMASLLQERLKVNPTPRNHLLLAKTYVKLNRMDKAEEQAQAALKLAPKDFTANLTVAALLLQRGEDTLTLYQAGVRLVEVGENYPKQPTRDQYMDYALLRGIYFALQGELKEAQQQLKEAADYDHEDKDVREALYALGQ